MGDRGRRVRVFHSPLCLRGLDPIPMITQLAAGLPTRRLCELKLSAILCVIHWLWRVQDVATRCEVFYCGHFLQPGDLQGDVIEELLQVRSSRPIHAYGTASLSASHAR